MFNRFKLKKAAGTVTVADYLAEAQDCVDKPSEPSLFNRVGELEKAIGHLIDAIDMIAHKRSPLLLVESGDFNVGIGAKGDGAGYSITSEPSPNMPHGHPTGITLTPQQQLPIPIGYVNAPSPKHVWVNDDGSEWYCSQCSAKKSFRTEWGNCPGVVE